MADNTTLNPGTGGDVIASDDIGGVKFQRVKISVGADGSATDATETTPLPVSDGHSGNLLLRILQMLMAPLGYDKSLGRQRGTVIVESGTVTAVTTVTTVTTLTTLGNISAVGGYSAQMTVFDQNRSAWAQCVRARIT
jgi:hypothetical protein